MAGHKFPLQLLMVEPMIPKKYYSTYYIKYSLVNQDLLYTFLKVSKLLNII